MKNHSSKPFWNSRKIFPLIAKWRWYNGTSWFAYATTYPSTDTRTGANNPDWEKKIEEGLDAGTTYTRYVKYKLLEDEPVDWVWTQWKNSLKKEFYTYKIQDQFPLSTVRTDFNFGTPDVDAVRSRAKIAFMNDIRAAQTPFQALPFLGELKETIGMLRHPLKGIAQHTNRYARDVRRNSGRLKKAGHISDLLSDMYLQWTYGVSPLIGDIDNAGAAIGRLREQTPLDIPLYVTASDAINGSDGKTVVPGSTVGCDVLHTYVGSVKVRVKGALKWDISIPGTALRTIGVNLNEFVPTLWELLPYSFLIDYVTNVGDLIGAACTSTSGIRWYWASQTVRKTRINYVTPRPIAALSRTYPIETKRVALETRSFERYKPSLSVSLRDFSFQLPSLRQEVNAAVLAFTRLRGALR